VKNTSENLKNKIISRYFEKNDNSKNLFKSTDINVLLNRVKANQKNESRKKIYFSLLASTGLLLFGIAIF
jgi:site-specific recombinase XerD